MSGAIHRKTYRATVGSQEIDLPLVPIGNGLAISLLMTIDCGVHFAEKAGRDLAARLMSSRPDIVATAATMGIPVAIEVTRSLGLDDYVVLQKSDKVHLKDALSEPVVSITTTGTQRLLLDRARIPALAGRRVAFVDDVVSTGSSARAALTLLRAAGAEIVAVGALLTEATSWRNALGDDARLIHSLGQIPLFAADGDGWREVWE